MTLSKENEAAPYELIYDDFQDKLLSEIKQSVKQCVQNLQFGHKR